MAGLESHRPGFKSHFYCSLGSLDKVPQLSVQLTCKIPRIIQPRGTGEDSSGA